MYGYKCEHCDGLVREKIVAREAFKYRKGFVILENVPVGVCDNCGTRYYHASLLHRVAEVAAGRIVIDKTESVPVAHFA
jgi:YgiT-type zinc finger domain-containing protein